MQWLHGDPPDLTTYFGSRVCWNFLCFLQESLQALGSTPTKQKCTIHMVHIQRDSFTMKWSLLISFEIDLGSFKFSISPFPWSTPETMVGQDHRYQDHARNCKDITMCTPPKTSLRAHNPLLYLDPTTLLFIKEANSITDDRSPDQGGCQVEKPRWMGTGWDIYGYFIFGIHLWWVTGQGIG